MQKDAIVQPGRNCSCISISDTTYKAVVSSICEHIPEIKDTEIRIQAIGFCSALSAGLARLQPGIDMDPMFVEIGDDESYFEWMFDNFRFGYSLKHDISDSYWFLVAKDTETTSRRFKGDFKTGFAPSVDYTLNYIGSNA